MGTVLQPLLSNQGENMGLRLKSIIITASVIATVCSAALPAAAEEPVGNKIWTMKEAVVFALKNSPDSRIATQRINAATETLKKAESAFLPRLNLIASYDQTDNPMYSFGNILNQGNFDNSIDFNDPGRTDNLMMKAEVLYRLYNGGKDQAGKESAEAHQLSTRLEKRVTEHRLGLEVVTAFQRIVQASEQVEASMAELKAINASLDVARARFEAGDLLKTELLNFEVQKARVSEQLIASNHSLKLARKVFLNLLGLEAGSSQIDTGRDLSQSLPEKLTSDLRPEIAALSARISAAEAALKVAEGAGLPTIDTYAGYQYEKGFVIDGSGDSWAAGIRLNYNLYDGDMAAAEIGVKKAELENIREQLIKLQLAVNLEIQQAELNCSQAMERKAVTDKMVEVARESAQLSRERFKEGVILSSDLIDVEGRLTDALVRQSAARTNYQIAVANLRYAVGQQQFADTTETLLEEQK